MGGRFFFLSFQKYYHRIKIRPGMATINLAPNIQREGKSFIIFEQKYRPLTLFPKRLRTRNHAFHGKQLKASGVQNAAISAHRLTFAPEKNDIALTIHRNGPVQVPK